jgi:transposase
MANQVTDMSKVRKVIQQYCQGSSKLFISKYLSISRNTVKKYISLFQFLELSIDDINNKSDTELEAIFSSDREPVMTDKMRQLHAFFPYMERELKKVGATQHQLWEEYLEKYPEGYRRSQFQSHYAQWNKRVNPQMHITHKSGDKLYIDYAGKKLEIVDKHTGEITEVEFFVAILGASQYTYAEASASQKKEDFVQSIANALEFYGGVPAAIVPDNLKSAVIKSNRYEPTINETLLDMAEHYQTTILPARAYRPRDKALVEGAVKILYRRVYNKVKEEEYTSIEALNERIAELLEEHNSSIRLTGRPYTRSELFEQIEKDSLRAMPIGRYQIKQQCFSTVMQNSHVLLGKDKHYYSVPYQYIRKKVKLLYTQADVEIYFGYNRIATHLRSNRPYNYTTQQEHLASNHQFLTDWTPERFIHWASQIGNDTKEFIFNVIEHRQHPEQAYKSCMGILSFAKKVGEERLNSACKRANEYQIYNYKTIQNILEKGLDCQNIFDDNDHLSMPEHDNVRGNDYYH